MKNDFPRNLLANNRIGDSIVLSLSTQKFHLLFLPHLKTAAYYFEISEQQQKASLTSIHPCQSFRVLQIFNAPNVG
jgi:hypothetical protein